MPMVTFMVALGTNRCKVRSTKNLGEAVTALTNSWKGKEGMEVSKKVVTSSTMPEVHVPSIRPKSEHPGL